MNSNTRWLLVVTMVLSIISIMVNIYKINEYAKHGLSSTMVKIIMGISGVILVSSVLIYIIHSKSKPSMKNIFNKATIIVFVVILLISVFFNFTTIFALLKKNIF